MNTSGGFQPRSRRPIPPLAHLPLVLLALASTACKSRSTPDTDPQKSDLPALSTSNASAPPPSSAPGSGSKAGNIVAREAVIPGKLSVVVHAHTLESPNKGVVPCWTYVSEGLWPLGQKEIVITVKREPGEAESAYPRDLLDLYATLHDLAAQKRLVDDGGFTEIGPAGNGLAGRADFRGVLYTYPQRFEGVPVQSPHLTALLVTRNELKAAQAFGVTRFMALLGQEYRFYPTAPWADRKRPELTSPTAMEGSFLNKTARATVSNIAVRKEGDKRVVMDILPKAKALAKQLAERGAKDKTLTLLVNLDPSADSCLVWSPDPTARSAISMPGSKGARMSGNFIMLVGDQPEDSVGILEDGFALLLTSASFDRVLKSLSSGEPLSLPKKGTMPGFDIAWPLDSYVNPVDGQVYVAEGGFRTYTADGSASDGSLHLSDLAKEVVLLTAPADIEARVTVPALGAFTKAIDDAVVAQVKATPVSGGHDLIVQCEVAPGGKKTFSAAARPEFQGGFAKALDARLMEIAAPEVRGGPVKFQVKFALNGGSGLPDSDPAKTP